MIENLNLRYTEDILNNTNWINKDGEILNLSQWTKDTYKIHCVFYIETVINFG